MESLDLFDEARSRAVPVAAYGKGPVILFSVGYGGGRGGYAYLARDWARRGFRVLVVEHVGSNLEALQRLKTPGMRQSELAEKVTAAVADPAELSQRPADLRFVLRQQGVAPPFGLGGHSYGSTTVLAAAGLEGVGFDAGERLGPVGVLALSPSPPGQLLTGYARPLPPVLMVTGTHDDFGASPSQRMRAFEALGSDTERALALVRGADHMNFAGIGLNVGERLATIAALTGQFWDAVFAGQPLTDPGLPGVEWRAGGLA